MGVPASLTNTIGLSTPAISAYPCTNPTNVGKDYIGSVNLTNNGTTPYIAGPVTGTVLVSGDAVASILDQSANANNGSQATGANRFTYLTNQIGGKAALQPVGATSSYTTLANIPLTGVFTVYVVGKATSIAANYIPVGNSGSGAFLGAFNNSARRIFQR